MSDFAAMRAQMVDGQILPRNVTDPSLIDALYQVPREIFVPANRRGIAYVDEDLEIAPGRYLIEPVVCARLLQAAEIGADDVALDVGCASGYQAAVLGQLASTVFAVESDPELRALAQRNLAELGVDNAIVVDGDAHHGHAEAAPYDVIAIGGAVDAVPPAILDQLAEGGRLVAVVGRGGAGKATLYQRVHGIVGRRVLFDAALPVLPGFEKAPGFVF